MGEGMKDRTKLALSMAFAELLKDKSIEKITIQNIVDQSGYNRQTFYYHFRDIYDMMAWNVANLLKAAEETVEPDESLEDVLLRVFKLLRQYRTQIIHAYDPNQRREYEKFFEPWLKENFHKAISDLDEADQVSEDKIDFMTEIFTWVSLSMIFQWVEDGMPKKTEEKLHDSFILFETSVTSSLARFAQEEQKKREESQGKQEPEVDRRLIEFSDAWYGSEDLG